ncbi:MAG TPA: BamA/TamA family outer membrane protein [Gemmatimonadales bacterium]|nr:BamA/TamA family outer membrane protein [Gemmatimonadales bacterium]
MAALALARAAALASALLLGAGVLAAQETPRVVRRLAFEGNSAIRDEVLASGIATTNSSWFARAFLFRTLGLGEKRYFDEQEFKRDVVRLEVLYRRSGYPRVQIDTVLRRTPTNVYITFRIREGEPIRVTDMAVTGLDTLPEKPRTETLVDLPLQPGDPFNRYIMQATADTITRRLRDRGRPSARVFTSFETNKDAGTATVAFDAVPGRSAAIGTVDVIGTNRIEPQLVRNLLVSRPGRLYSQDETYQSQRNLYSSDLFRYATVNIDSTKFSPTADSVPLLVQVSEARRRRVRGGLGYGTDDCFRGSLGWTTRNFLGSGGRILDLTSRISKVGLGAPFDWGLENSICNGSSQDTVGSAKVNFNLGASVRRPAFLSPNNTIAVSLFTERRSEFKVYLRQETGTAVTLRRETPKRRIPLSLAYTLSYGRTEATPESFCASFNACTPDLVSLLRQNRVLATLTATGTIPQVNNPLDPSRGSVSSLELTWSSRFLGSSSFQQFFRAVGDYSWYRPIARDVVFSWRLRGGAIFAPTVDVATQSGNFIPPEQRFYAGGPNDVRGFERNELGSVVYVVTKGEVDSAASAVPPRAINPDRVTVAATGGNTLAVGNVELRVPSPVFSSRLRLAAFVDAGGVWQRGSGNPAAIRVTPGAGLRLSTPLGPARLDVAYNPYKLQAGPLFQVDTLGNLTAVPGQDSYVKERSSKFTFHVAVGQAF